MQQLEKSAGHLQPFVPENTASERVWQLFKDISAIPRPSGEEQGVRDYIARWVREHFPEAQVMVDALGNMSVRMPATEGAEALSEICFQSHMDMVCLAAPHKAHDFRNDGIMLLTDGEWVSADGTTLGADNGIGVATMMAFAERLVASGKRHGRVVLLFTAEEETHNRPAVEFNPKDHGIDTDIPYIISLDGNHEGAIGVYCAGYQDIEAAIDLVEDKTFDRSGGRDVCLRVHGLPGGHSGLTAHKRLPSANRALFKGILPLLPRGTRLLADMHGGEAKNSWPMEAHAHAWIPDGEGCQWMAGPHRYLEEAGAPGTLEVRPMERRIGALRRDLSEKIVRMFSDLADGVHHVTASGEVLLSSNFGIVKTVPVTDANAKAASQLCIDDYVRGNVEKDLARSGAEIRDIFLQAGARVTAGPVVPGCTTPSDAQLVQAAIAACTEVIGGALMVGGHVFVEVGAIAAKLKAQATVLGATILEEHTVRERVNIASVPRLLRSLEKTYELLVLRGD